MIKFFLIALSLFSCIGLLVSIAFGVPMLPVSNSPLHFTQEQYFYLGVINFIIALTCMRIYASLDSKNDEYLKPNFNASKNMFVDKIYQWGKKVQWQYVDKSKIPQLKFYNEDVLSNEESMARERDLHRALYLGNSLKHKVKIFFKDKESIKYTETTIWDANHHHIYLKSGIILPVKSVYKIEL
jgi:hypothetical protein